MDKISSIVPSNKRVTTVDVKASGVGRSGTPGFGRDVNVTNDRLHGHAEATSAAAMARHNDQMAVRQPLRESEKAAIVTKMTDKFFTNKEKENEMPMPEIKSEDKFNVEDMQMPTIQTKPAAGPLKGGANEAEVREVEAAMAEEEMPTVGGHLDVHA